MYCYKCAAPNIESARFCRVCGADISATSKALAGLPADSQLETAEPCALDIVRGLKKAKRQKRSSFEGGIKNIFVGIGFIVVAIALSFSRSGYGWWFWMLIPGFSCIGGGVAEVLRARQKTASSPVPVAPSAPLSPAPQAYELPRHNTGETVPPSITESTTRHLDSQPAARRPLESSHGS